MKQQKPKSPEAPSTAEALPPQENALPGGLHAALEAYLQRACEEVDVRIERLLAQQLPPHMVTPELGYVTQLCQTAREHQVDVAVDLRAGTVSVRSKDFYPDVPRGVIGAGIAGKCL